MAICASVAVLAGMVPLESRICLMNDLGCQKINGALVNLIPQDQMNVLGCQKINGALVNLIPQDQVSHRASFLSRIHFLEQIRRLDCRSQYAILSGKVDTSYPTGGYNVSVDLSRRDT
nr:hypothetical protein [Tanacetum cinerariifolium]